VYCGNVSVQHHHHHHHIFVYYRSCHTQLSHCTARYYSGSLWDRHQKCLFPWGSGPHLIHGSLGQRESSSQTASRSVQWFPQGTDIQTNKKQTHMPTDRPRLSWCSNMAAIARQRCDMRPKAKLKRSSFVLWVSHMIFTALRYTRAVYADITLYC